MPLISGKVGRQSYEIGDRTRWAMSHGQSVTFADRIEPLADIVSRLEAEAICALERLRSF